VSFAGSVVSLSGSEGGFVAPGPESFNLPPVFTVAGVGVTKPMLELVLVAILVLWFFWVASHKRAMVPSKLQFAGEFMYSGVRNGLGRDLIGSKDFMPFVPYLVTLFFFILVSNWMGAIPFIQFPPFSRVSMAYALAALSWVIYNAVGIRRHGFLGYLKRQTVPGGVSGPILALLIPLEFFSNLIVRPITLSLRLFANMFAGHILALLFATGGEYLLLHADTLIKPVGILAWVMAIAIAFLEILVQFLQAYVFALLNAMYISGALAEEH
jgi:F-type H+-transporting ATPase subunit a